MFYYCAGLRASYFAFVDSDKRSRGPLATRIGLHTAGDSLQQCFASVAPLCPESGARPPKNCTKQNYNVHQSHGVQTGGKQQRREMGTLAFSNYVLCNYVLLNCIL